MTEGKLCLRLLSRPVLPIAALLIALPPASLRAQENTSASGAAQTQNTAPQLPKFDVASIKPHQSEGMRMRAGMQLTPDGISATGAPLSMLLHEAFGLPADRILNEPDWVNSARYDIEAKVDPDDAPKLEKLTPKERVEMLLPLLEDRFGLKFHHETKTLEVYALVVAKGGPKLKAATDDNGGESADAAPPPLGGPDGDGGVKLPRSAMMMRMSPDGMTMEGHDATADQLAQAITVQLGSTVVNETGLKGKYDYTLTFAPEMGGRMMGMPPPGAGDGGAPPPPQGPSIFAAVQEQLGLKLEAKKEPVDAVVIDHIERPSAN